MPLSDPRLWVFVPLAGRLLYSLFEQSVNGLSCDLLELPVTSSTSLPNGKSRQLTNWGGGCTGNPTATADGNRLDAKGSHLRHVTKLLAESEICLPAAKKYLRHADWIDVGPTAEPLFSG